MSKKEEVASAAAAGAAAGAATVADVNLTVKVESQEEEKPFPWKKALAVVGVCAVAGGAFYFRENIGGLFE